MKKMKKLMLLLLSFGFAVFSVSAQISEKAEDISRQAVQ